MLLLENTGKVKSALSGTFTKVVFLCCRVGRQLPLPLSLPTHSDTQIGSEAKRVESFFKTISVFI